MKTINDIIKDLRKYYKNEISNLAGGANPNPENLIFKYTVVYTTCGDFKKEAAEKLGNSKILVEELLNFDVTFSDYKNDFKLIKKQLEDVQNRPNFCNFN